MNTTLLDPRNQDATMTPDSVDFIKVKFVEDANDSSLPIAVHTDTVVLKSGNTVKCGSPLNCKLNSTNPGLENSCLTLEADGKRVCAMGMQ